MAIAPERAEIGIRRHFTTEGVHPYDEVRWERRDARIVNFRVNFVGREGGRAQRKSYSNVAADLTDPYWLAPIGIGA